MLAVRVVQQTHVRKRIELGCIRLQTGDRTASFRSAPAGLPGQRAGRPGRRSSLS